MQYSALIRTSPPHAILAAWILLSFAVSLWFFRPGALRIPAYYAAELALTGSLTLYLISRGQLQALNFIGLQVIVFGYLGTKTVTGKIAGAAPFLLLIPATPLLSGLEVTVWEMALKGFDFVLFYGVGACFRHLARQNREIREKNLALEQHTKVIERLMRRGQPNGSPQAANAAEPDAARDFGLTARELEVMGCLAEGLKNRDIAARLYLSEGSVRNHVSSIYAKLEVPNRSSAIRKFRHGR